MEGWAGEEAEDRAEVVNAPVWEGSVRRMGEMGWDRMGWGALERRKRRGGRDSTGWESEERKRGVTGWPARRVKCDGEALAFDASEHFSGHCR